MLMSIYINLFTIMSQFINIETFGQTKLSKIFS